MYTFSNLQSIVDFNFLTSKAFFDLYTISGAIDSKLLKNTSISDFRKIKPNLPNYIINEYLYDYNLNYYQLFLTPLINITEEFLIYDNDEIYVKRDKLEEWQIIINNINPLMLISYKISELNIEEEKKNILIEKLFKHTALPSIKLSENEDNFFNYNDIYDNHLHMNGISEVTSNWQYSLLNIGSLKDIFKDVKNNLLFFQNDLTNKISLYSIIKKAKHLQEYIYDFLNKKNTKIIDKVAFMNYIKNENAKDYQSSYFYEEFNFNSNFLIQKVSIWTKAYQYLNNAEVSIEDKNLFAYILHYYILVYSIYSKFMVHQIDQYGFEQFQLISENKFRKKYEKEYYKNCFNQLYSMNKIDSLNIEIRFSPKELDEIEKELKGIINSKSSFNSSNISFTAHFIKKNIKEEESSYVLICRQSKLRNDIKKKCEFLYSLLLKYHNSGRNYTCSSNEEINLNEYFNSIDAANNELDASPEIFSSSFNKFKKDVMNNLGKRIYFTFHGGEDFIHIISGIRYVYEIYNFIDYEAGDRIAHAIALGLCPKKWRDKIGNKIKIRKGEWLDNLIFIYNLLNLDDEVVLDEIKLLWRDIYDIEFISIEKCFEIYLLRKNGENNINEIEDEYNKKVYEKYQYHYECHNEKKVIETELMLDKIVSLQNFVLNEIKEKKIAIEIMISSNVRISFYDQYKEHHIFKWIDDKSNLPHFFIATDNPGIFNTNIKNEYSHLSIILQKNNKSNEEISDIFNYLNTNAKKYSFIK